MPTWHARPAFSVAADLIHAAHAMLVRQLSPESLDPPVEAPSPSVVASPAPTRPGAGKRARQGGLGTWVRRLYVGHLVAVWALALSNLFHGLAIVGTGMAWRRGILARWAWPRWSPLLRPLGLYVVCLAVSVAFSQDRGVSLGELDEIIALSTLPLGALLIRGPRAARRVVDGILAMIALVAVIGIVQYYFTDFGGIEKRIPGPFSHYQTFAGVLLIGGLLLIARLAAPGRRHHLAWWGALAVISWTLVLTLTRGSWVAFAAAFGALVVLRGRRRTLIVGLLGLLAALALAPNSWQERARTIWDLRDPSNYDRLCMLEAGGYMVRERPFFGVGPNVVRQRYPIYRHPTAPRYTVKHLHNSFVQLAAERGLLSLGTYLWLMIAAMALAYRGYRRTMKRGGRDADLYLGVLLVLIGFNVAGLFEANWRDTEVQRLVLFVLAIPLCLMAARRPRSAS